MTDAAVCHWIWLRETEGFDGEKLVPEESGLNMWMGRLINHCSWTERDIEIVCPPGVELPEPRCPK